MKAEQPANPRRLIRRHQMAGLLVAGLVVGGVGSWAAADPISRVPSQRQAFSWSIAT